MRFTIVYASATGHTEDIAERLKVLLPGSELKDLDSIVLVGGGSRIPLIKNYLSSICNSIPFLTPPPIEAIALGALKLTPNVQIKDVLNKGVSLRCWNKKNEKHIWHPLFLAGQTWPTNKPLEIILAASINSQLSIDLIIGEPQEEGSNEIIYTNGLPTLATIESKDNCLLYTSPSPRDS